MPASWVDAGRRWGSRALAGRIAMTLRRPSVRVRLRFLGLCSLERPVRRGASVLRGRSLWFGNRDKLGRRAEDRIACCVGVCGRWQLVDRLLRRLIFGGVLDVLDRTGVLVFGPLTVIVSVRVMEDAHANDVNG